MTFSGVRWMRECDVGERRMATERAPVPGQAKFKCRTCQVLTVRVRKDSLYAKEDRPNSVQRKGDGDGGCSEGSLPAEALHWERHFSKRQARIVRRRQVRLGCQRGRLHTVPNLSASSQKPTASNPESTTSRLPQRRSPHTQNALLIHRPPLRSVCGRPGHCAAKGRDYNIPRRHTVFCDQQGDGCHSRCWWSCHARI